MREDAVTAGTLGDDPSGVFDHDIGAVAAAAAAERQIDTDADIDTRPEQVLTDVAAMAAAAADALGENAHRGRTGRVDFAVVHDGNRAGIPSGSALPPIEAMANEPPVDAPPRPPPPPTLCA